MSKYKMCSACLQIGGYCGSCSGDVFQKWSAETRVSVTLHDLKSDTFFEKDVVVPAGADAGFFLDRFSKGGVVVDSWTVK